MNISHLIILWNGKYFVHLQQNIETITILKIIQFPKVCCALALCLLFLLGGQRAGAYNDHRVGKIDSIENHLLSNRQKMTDDEIMDCLKKLMRGYLPRDSRKHDRYCQEALALTYKHNWLNSRKDVLTQLGLQYYGQEKYEEAERYFFWALAVTDSMKGDKRYTEEDRDDNYSQLYGSLGNLYNIQDKALLAIEYYQKALPIFEKYGWLESQATLHHVVAELWLSMGNNEKAETEYLKGIQVGEASGDSLMMVLPRRGLVKVYLDKGDYDRARETVMPAYHYYKAHRDEESDDYAETLSSLVKLHLMDGHEDLAKAEAYATEALFCVNEEMDSETRFDVYAAATMVAMKEKSWKQALEFGLKSVHEDDEKATLSDVSCYEMIAQIYMQLGNKEKASEYINKVRRTMEQFATNNYQSSLSQMEVLYETEKKEAEIAQLTKERRWFLWGGILTALVLLLMATVFFLLWRSNRLKRKTDLILAKLEGEQAERVRIARDLHDRLGGLLTALRIRISENAEDVNIPLIDQAIREMRNVSHHLLPDSLSRHGLRTALTDYCATMKNVSFSFYGEERRIAHEEALYCIIHELVNNAVKSAQARKISVQMMVGDDYTRLNVSDDGIGLPTEDSEEGMGLSNIRERVAAIGGRIDISSQEGKGTEINIEIKNEDQDD